MPVLNIAPSIRVGAQHIARAFFNGEGVWPPGGGGDPGAPSVFPNFRLLITGMHDSYVEIAEFEIYTEVGGANLAAGRPATASSIYSAGYEADKAFDGDSTTRWITETGPTLPQWLAVELPFAVTPHHYILRMSTHNDPPQSPSSFELQGFANDEWYTLDTRINEWQFNNGEYRVYLTGELDIRQSSVNLTPSAIEGLYAYVGIVVSTDGANAEVALQVSALDGTYKSMSLVYPVPEEPTVTLTPSAIEGSYAEMGVPHAAAEEPQVTLTPSALDGEYREV